MGKKRVYKNLAVRELKGGHINDGREHKPIYNGDIKNPTTLVIKLFDTDLNRIIHDDSAFKEFTQG